MRLDAVGFFWDDTPPPPPPKAEKVKRSPPYPSWLEPEYLPGLAEARAFPAYVMSFQEVEQAAERQEELIVDVESFANYFLVCFTSLQTGHVFYLEFIEGGVPLNTIRLRWVFESFVTCGFNSNSYDMIVCILAMEGLSPSQLKAATNRIILDEVRGSDVLREFKVKNEKFDHIDLIEVAPLSASLKAYAGRLHAQKMQDLPFAPETMLSENQITIVRWYCVNDTRNTIALRECLAQQIDLRKELTSEYGIDLRSKSDAQIAESVIGAEISKIVGKKPKKPSIEIGTSYSYRVPSFLKFESELLRWALSVISNAQFIVDHTGSIGMPEEIKSLDLDINGSVYRMGIGGLHSSEQTVSYQSDDDNILIDKDVTSYYPYIILNLGLAPHHIGRPFLQVYRSIVERRIQAKKDKKKVIAESLKIVVNGSFGKLGSKWSILYSPDLLTQVTITGQLSLLMLIERLEIAGIRVVSANTDGIVIYCPRLKEGLLNEIVSEWETDTGFPTESTYYDAIYSRDVNNYIAVKQDGTTKTKGSYANPWSDGDSSFRLHKNPTATICVEAVEAYLTRGVAIEDTIRTTQDITKFVVVRTVRGGGVKVWEDETTEYLGKTVRWYYAEDIEGELVYAKSGNKVPRSDGARPLMVLPDEFPSDIDYGWYETEAKRILRDIGAVDASEELDGEEGDPSSNES